MLVLAKAAMAMMLGFILSIVAGLILIPLLKKIKAGQNVSTTIGERHLKKNGTPTLGGLIFIIPTIVTLILLMQYSIVPPSTYPAIPPAYAVPSPVDFDIAVTVPVE